MCPHIEAAHPLMEAPHLRGMEEAGDQTTEVDYGQEKKTQKNMMPGL